jgi:hypothetical protein
VRIQVPAGCWSNKAAAGSQSSAHHMHVYCHHADRTQVSKVFENHTMLRAAFFRRCSKLLPVLLRSPWLSRETGPGEGSLLRGDERDHRRAAGMRIPILSGDEAMVGDGTAECGTGAIVGSQSRVQCKEGSADAGSAMCSCPMRSKWACIAFMPAFPSKLIVHFSIGSTVHCEFFQV